MTIIAHPWARPGRPAGRRAVRPWIEVLEERCLPDGSGFLAEPVIPTITTVQQAHWQGIYRYGLARGNRAFAVSKVGDSITALPSFLDPLGVPGYNPTNPFVAGAYTGLANVITFFDAVPVDTSGANSFAHASWAAAGGWRTEDVLNPALNFSPDRAPGESALQTELRLTRPSFALVMFGTNDLGLDNDPVGFRVRLTQIAEIAISLGVIPVLSTIPDNYTNGGLLEPRVPVYNEIIAEVAGSLDVPLWNYWAAMQPLPSHGMEAFGLHPDVYPAGGGFFTPDGLQYGFNVRNLTAVQVLDKLLTVVVYNGPADDAWPPGPVPDDIANYVTALYQTLLDRMPTAADVVSYGKPLQANWISRQTVAAIIWDSAEHRGLEVRQYYATYLHRSPGPDEVAGWVTAFHNGVSEAQVQADFLTSAEYQAAHPTDELFVQGLYQDVLGRPADPDGLANHEEALAQGMSRTVVALSVLLSAERETQLIDADYTGFLGRPASPPEEQIWLMALLRGDSPEGVGEGILASQEYYARAQT